MGSISIDPAELDSAGSALQDVAAKFDGTESRLSIVSLSDPRSTAAQLPQFEDRWTRWIMELHEVIGEFSSGLVSAAAYYRQREAEIAAWAER